MARCAMLEMISYSRWKRSASSNSRGEVPRLMTLSTTLRRSRVAPREEHRGEIAGGDLLDDGVAGDSNRGGVVGGREQRLGRQLGGARFGAGLADRLEQRIAGDARQRQIVLRAALQRSDRRQLAALLGEYDAVGAGLRAQHLRQMVEPGAGQRLIAEIDLQDHGVRGPLLDELAPSEAGVGAPGTVVTWALGQWLVTWWVSHWRRLASPPTTNRTGPVESGINRGSGPR